MSVKEYCSNAIAYEFVSRNLCPNMSENLICLIANDDNNFVNQGIYAGMHLIFDCEKEEKEGSLSCYYNSSLKHSPKYKLSTMPLDGYKYVGRLVLAIRNFEV